MAIIRRRYSVTDGVILFINLIFGIVNFFLLVRFLFRLFGANRTAPFVDWLYNVTSPLLAPFRGIFATQEVADGAFLEFSTLLAVVFYIFINFVIVQIIKYLIYIARGYEE